MGRTKKTYFSIGCLSIKLSGKLSGKLLAAIAVAAFLLCVTTPPEANAWRDAKWQQGANIKENLTDLTIRSLCSNQTPANPALEHYPVPVPPVVIQVHPVPMRPVPLPPVPVYPVPVRPVLMPRR